MSLFECGAHHLSIDAGTCYVGGCFRKLKAVEEPSEAAVNETWETWLHTVNLDAYWGLTRGKLYKSLPHYARNQGSKTGITLDDWYAR